MKTFPLMLAAGLLAVTVNAQELTWAKLVQHPEFWPAQCKLTHGFDFQSGAKVNASDTVTVLEIHSKQVEVGTTTGKIFAFDVKPDDTDVLAEAQAAYAKLTPEQRALTYAGIFRNQNLWPYRVTLKTSFDLGGGRRVNQGDQVILRSVKGRQLEVGSEKYDTRFEVDPEKTDLMEQARKYVELPDGAPSRMVVELQPNLINALTGQPDPLNTNALPRYFAFVRAANFCPLSQHFMPELVKFYNEMKPKHPDFEVIYLSCDGKLPDLEKFAKDKGFSWPTVTYQRSGYLFEVIPHLQPLMPQLTIMDQRGHVLITGCGEARNGIVQATSSNGKGSEPVPNAQSAAAALQQFAALLSQAPASK
ncbi:MAG TPA: thioredoxin family protein [Verrucomicrobiae bacterium]